MISDIETARLASTLQTQHLKLFEQIQAPYYFGCRLRILVVADGFLYFNEEDFGFSELVNALRSMSTFRYPVTVNTAHRRDPGASRLNGAVANFRFSDDSLRGYHQVWLMAAERNTAGARLGTQERLALRRFMDAGGGVFATGDHEDLGAAMGGYLPRVRSMRAWFWPGAGPEGEPVAPDGGSAQRHDTNRPGHDTGFSFNDQSDDVAQQITPIYFGGGFIRSVHPVLCSPAGPIRVLPDHPHEGECLVPADLHATYTIDGDAQREYPDGADGQPVAPQIIARATMLAGAAVPEFGKPPIAGGQFGVIGAWDGHKAGRFGRIVVDATWHHFTNINLIGDRSLGAPNPAVPKTMGFLHTAAGRATYETIKTYYRNIADWLTPRSMRRCLIQRHIWCVVQQGQVLESLRLNDALFTGRLISQGLFRLGLCDRFSILTDLVVEVRPDLARLLDPLGPVGPDVLKDFRTLDSEAGEDLATQVVDQVLGAVALQMHALNLTPEALRKQTGEEEPDVKVLEEATQRGVKQGIAQAVRHLKQRTDDVARFASALN